MRTALPTLRGEDRRATPARVRGAGRDSWGRGGGGGQHICTCSRQLRSGGCKVALQALHLRPQRAQLLLRCRGALHAARPARLGPPLLARRHKSASHYQFAPLVVHLLMENRLLNIARLHGSPLHALPSGRRGLLPSEVLLY